MPGPKYNYLNVRDELLITSGAISFADRDLWISSSADGQLDLIADTTVKVTTPTCELEATTVTLDGNTTVDTGHSFTVTSGAVNLGTAALSLGGHATLAADKYLSFTAGSESIRLPNDGVIASGQYAATGANVGWTTPIVSSQVSAWMRVKVLSGASTWQTFYAPLFSSNTATEIGGL